MLALGGLSLYLYTTKPYRLGLDVQGGVRLTYQMVVPEKDRAQLPEYRERTLSLLAKRIEGQGGASEATVQAKGEDQFVIELPGIKDLDEAAARIGSSARIQIFDARNVVSDGAPYRRYTPVPRDDAKTPTVEFSREGAQEAIKFGDAEYARIIAGWGEPLIVGQQLKRASMLQNGADGFKPGLAFNAEGARRMEAWSRRHQQDGQQLATVLDGRVLSVVPLQKGAILGDQAEISGQFKAGYVKSLVDLLNGGSLPVDLRRLSAEQIDATIGAQALDKIVMAGFISFGVITLFLIAYYALPGVIALLALCLYVLFTLTALKLIDATFSLAAIAGFILSVGMAVDANVLVFERFKEEVKSGKPINTAMELGFKRALPAIFDSNACTILTSLVLAQLGTGPVKGFATTLIIGVAISLFTAITVTRSLLLFFGRSGMAENRGVYAVERNWFGNFENRDFKIVEKSKKWFLISALTIAIPSVFFLVGGFKLNVEFQGGYEAVYSVGRNTVTAPEIAERLEKSGLKGSNVKLGSGAGGERLAYITVPPLKELEGNDDAAISRIATAAGLRAEDRKGFTKIGGTVQAETLRNAVLGVVLSSALIVLYLAFRFGLGVGGFVAGLRFGLSAVGALLHDMLVIFGLAAMLGYLLKWEVSALFLTAMLTIIGFSVHDTIVIFDRIRENLQAPEKGEDFAGLINRSVKQSFARSINTSLTVITTLAILVFFGTTTPDLKFFVATMLLGILSGTYSSIYNASPILYLWDKAIGRKRGPEHTLVGMANAEIARQRVVQSGAGVPSGPVTVGADGRSYGQVRRRASAVDRSKKEID